MTTRTYTSVIDHTSDAGFRAWGSELGTNLAAAGLVQTTDTGQINWGTVTRPIANTAGGYEIWRFADSSLFLKIEYGTGAGVTTPQMWATVGTGSNGSGTLTGQLSTRNIWTATVIPFSAVTVYTTYLCVVAGAFAIQWKQNGSANLRPLGFLVVGKTVDSTGATTVTGYGVLRMNASTPNLALQSVRIAATAATFTESPNHIVFPGGPTTSAVGADIQAYMSWLNTPAVTPFLWAPGYIQAEVTALNTFAVAMVGAVSHTYLACGAIMSGQQLNGQAAGTYSYGMIYE